MEVEGAAALCGQWRAGHQKHSEPGPEWHPEASGSPKLAEVACEHGRWQCAALRKTRVERRAMTSER